MSTVDDALSGFVAILADIDPDPQPAPVAIWEWPDDYASLDYSTFPFIIVAQVVNRQFSWQPAAQGVGYHSWLAEIMVFLAPGLLTRMEADSVAEIKHEPWLLAMATVLFNNQGVNGTALNIGAGDQLFTYRIGHLGWDKKLFWGIRFEVPIRQIHSLPAV